MSSEIIISHRGRIILDKTCGGEYMSMLTDFKMTKDGLVLVVKDYDNLENVLNEITSRIAEMGNFFAQGDKVMLLVENNEKHTRDMPIIVASLRKLGLEVSQILMGSSSGDNVRIRSRMKMIEEKDTKSGTKVIKKNLRSGQTIVHSGDVLVIGNVHAGAEIMAGGSIAVFGNAKGVLRAGLNEGKQAVIASVCLEASLLQIGGAILREVPAFSEPSVAHLREDNIVVERLNELKFVEE